MHIALSTRILAPHRGQGCRACLSKRKPHISLYPVACLAFSLLVSTVNVFDHISASSRIRPAPRGRYRGGWVIGGCGCVGGPTLSCERELACSCFASPQYTIPALPSSLSALSSSGGPLLFVTWWPKWSGGTEDHFGCKWLPRGPPAGAPLATPVALPRAFMPFSSPRIRVQPCTSPYSCTSSGLSPKSGCHCERGAHPSSTKAI